MLDPDAMARVALVVTAAFGVALVIWHHWKGSGG